MNRQLYLGLLLSLTCAVAQAQAFKCKTPDGKTVFSDTGCPSQSAVQSVRQSEYVSADRQRQAQEVNSRTSSQLQGLEDEKAEFAQRLQQQQAEQALIDRQNSYGKTGSEQNSANKACLDGAMRQSGIARRRMIAACNGEAFEDRPPPPLQPSAPPPLAIIKSCNGANCSDQMGNRYNTTAGKTVRSDGKRCYPQGNAMYCD